MRSNAGITLIETVVGVAVFAIIATATYQAIFTVQGIIQQADATMAAAALANERMEYIRGLPYADVGIVGGFPDGVIEQEETIIRSGWEFTVHTVIRNIDDPQFGQEGAANYKLAHLDITCDSCRRFAPVSMSTFVAPSARDEEPEGGLFILAFNANGEPLAGASVTVVNNEEDPPFTINDTTGNDGILRLVGLPPGVGAYEITVAGDGFSTDRTYSEDELSGESIPVKPHATVVAGSVTAISFAIDRLSELSVASQDVRCNAVPEVPFTLSGSKRIGMDPDILKYEENHITNGGSIILQNMEWDDYFARASGSSWSIAGSFPAFPLLLAPDAVQDLTLVVRDQNSDELLITVVDAQSGNPLTGAEILIFGDNEQHELIAGQTFAVQDDWSGGPGQPQILINGDQYWDRSEGVLDDSPPGTVTLQGVDEGTLTSSAFDLGSSTVFDELRWEAETPNGSSVRFQIATEEDPGTAPGQWTFVGPDGTSNTFYEEPGQEIAAAHDGDRGFRYRMFLDAGDDGTPPSVSEMSVTYVNDCVPPGQALAQGLSEDSYTIEVSHDGYVAFQDIVPIQNSWQRYHVALQPE